MIINYNLCALLKFQTVDLAGLSIDRDTNELATTSSCHIFRFSSLSICAWWVVLKHAQFQFQVLFIYLHLRFEEIFTFQFWFHYQKLNQFISKEELCSLSVFVFVTSIVRLNSWNSKLTGLKCWIPFISFHVLKLNVFSKHKGANHPCCCFVYWYLLSVFVLYLCKVW